MLRINLFQLLISVVLLYKIRYLTVLIISCKYYLLIFRYVQKVCEKLRYDRNQNRCGQRLYGTYSLMRKRDNECVHTDRVWGSSPVFTALQWGGGGSVKEIRDDLYTGHSHIVSSIWTFFTELQSLENPVDRGAWWAAVRRVSQSRTRLKRLSMHACTGEGNGNPLQCSCLENPRDGGAWWAAAFGVAQSWTRLK